MVNKERRKHIDELITDIEKAQLELENAPDDDHRQYFEGQITDFINRTEDLRDEEQESFDNMPEGLQNSDRGERSQEAVSAMEEAISGLEEARNIVEDKDEELWYDGARGQLENVCSNLSNAQD